MFLTDEALAQLTWLQRPSAMCRWLEREGIHFVVAADGKPRVLQAVIMGRLGGQVVPPNPEPRLRLRRAEMLKGVSPRLLWDRLPRPYN